MIPLDVSLSVTGTILNIINYFFDVLFVIDLLLNFITMYWDPKTNELVKSFKKIWFNYIFKGRFCIDFV